MITQCWSSVAALRRTGYLVRRAVHAVAQEVGAEVAVELAPHRMGVVGVFWVLEARDAGGPSIASDTASAGGKPRTTGN